VNISEVLKMEADESLHIIKRTHIFIAGNGLAFVR